MKMCPKGHRPVWIHFLVMMYSPSMILHPLPLMLIALAVVMYFLFPFCFFEGFVEALRLQVVKSGVWFSYLPLTSSHKFLIESSETCQFLPSFRPFSRPSVSIAITVGRVIPIISAAVTVSTNPWVAVFSFMVRRIFSRCSAAFISSFVEKMSSSSSLTVLIPGSSCPSETSLCSAVK